MNILLDGFFDNNYGDDMMRLIAVRSMRGHVFCAKPGTADGLLRHLAGEENFRAAGGGEITARVNVTGTGFMYHRPAEAARVLAKTHLYKEERYGRTAVINCSLEQTGGRLSRRALGEVLGRYGHISCRDEQSLDYIRRNVNADALMFEDMVFSAPELFGIERTDGRALGVSPVNRAGDRGAEAYRTALAEMCDSYAERTDGRILLFACDTGTEDDGTAVRGIISRMKHPEAAQAVLYDGDPVKFMRLFAQCGAVIGSRFHAIVTAAALGIPAAALSDREKTDRLCAKCGIECISRTDADGGAMIRLLGHTAPARGAESMRENARGHVDALEEYLEK